MAMCEAKQVITESFTSQQYSKGRFLGKGGFARVYEFTTLDTKEVFAAKIIEKSKLVKQRAKQKLMSEIKIHRSLSHSNIVEFKRFFEDNDNVYILLELCSNNTLNDLLRRRKRLSELETQFYLSQIFSALNYLHKLNVIHRDIKLGNLLLNEKLEIKLSDFGLASKLEYVGEKKRTICGTPNYIAPEVLDGTTGHSFAVDVWSMGVLAYTLLIGRPPFETDDVKKTYRRIKLNDYQFPDYPTISDDAKDLISKLLVLEPVNRPSIGEILEFTFFTKNSIPSTLPLSTLAVPPSPSFTGRYKKIPKTESSRKLSYESDRENQGGVINVLSPIIQKLAPAKNGSAKSQRKIICNTHYKGGLGIHTWVKRWVDYSSKYGVGYLMSNGCIGAYFNDSTKILSDANRLSFQYIYRDAVTKEQSYNKYSFDEYPATLKKKVTLLDHFRKHLVGKEAENEKESGVIVKKWLGTDHAIVFKLSNNLIQVNFTDRTELLLCSDSNTVVFTDKSQIATSYALDRALDYGNQELKYRIKYTKEVMNTLSQANSDKE